MRNSSVDGMVRAYFCAIEHAQNPASEYVTVYARKCGECGCPNRTIDATGPWRCANHRCGAEWPSVPDVPMPRGLVQSTPRPGRVDDRMADMAPIGIALNEMLADPRHRYDAQCLVGYALTAATYRDLALFARAARWPGRRWTEHGVDHALRSARTEFLRRLWSRSL